jgi:hypothetical protein
MLRSMMGMLMVLVRIHGLNREKAYAERFNKSRYSRRASRRGAGRAGSFLASSTPPSLSPLIVPHTAIDAASV